MLGVYRRNVMTIEQDSKTSAELTDRPAEDFELPENLEIPYLEDLTEVDADEFYSED